jgi:hypothetical protein
LSISVAKKHSEEKFARIFRLVFVLSLLNWKRLWTQTSPLYFPSVPHLSSLIPLLCYTFPRICKMIFFGKKVNVENVSSLHSFLTVNVNARTRVICFPSNYSCVYCRLARRQLKYTCHNL